MIKKKSEAEEKERRCAAEEVEYYKVLDGFAKSISGINYAARAEGQALPALRKKIQRTAPAFCVLSGMEQDARPPRRERQKRTYARLRDGWIVCPNCGNRTVKANPDTRLENFPVFCKRCKKESVINLR